MRRVPSFGGTWTEQKLDSLQRYLVEYMKILSKHPHYATWYVDGFASGGDRLAGTQSMESDIEAQGFLRGSARIALETPVAFDHYLFVDKNKARCDELEELRVAHSVLRGRIEIRRGDANSVLKGWCQETDW